MTNTIQEQIAKAREAAATLAAEAPAAQAPADNGNASAAVVPAAQRPVTVAKPTMASAISSSSLIPKNIPFAKINEFGIRVGKNDRIFKSEMIGKVLMVEDKGFQLKYTLRFGNPAVYLSTVDGISCDKGGSWADALARVSLIDPSIEPYVSADIILELTQAIEATGSDGKTETIHPGTRVAINLSKTNFSEWQDFYTLMAEQGQLEKSVDVRVGAKSITHGGNTWGVFTFEPAA